MRQIALVVLGLCLSALYAQVALAADSATGRGVAKYVVIISVDGLAASYFDDSRAELPTLQKLAADGSRAEGMLTTFPSVTWPSHVSLVTGATAAKHGVIGNAVWNRTADRQLTYIGDPELPKDKAIRCPTLYDAAHASGLKTASVIWPCSNGAKTLDFVIPDSNKPDLHARYTTPGFAKELASAGIDLSPLGEWGWSKDRSTARDLLYSQVAQYLLKKEEVNLLLLHYITPDGVEHSYGPHTPQAYAAVNESDQRIAEIWHVLQQEPFQGKSTLFVVSDHGFAPVEKTISPNVLFRQAGLIETDDAGKVTKRRAWCVSQGGSAFIYILDQAQCDETFATVRACLTGAEGVESILTAGEFTKLGLPDPEKNVEMADLVLSTGPGYAYNDGYAGDAIQLSGGYRGTHGHRTEPSYMHATFLAWGAGIQPGSKLKTIRNIDVAPTAAHLLGIDLPNAEGRVLTEILVK